MIDLSNAENEGDAAAVLECTRRLVWVQQKQDMLDREHIMVHDYPTEGDDGTQRPYGSLEERARRMLDDREIIWHDQMMAEVAADDEAHEEIPFDQMPICRKSQV